MRENSQQPEISKCETNLTLFLKEGKKLMMQEGKKMPVGVTTLMGQEGMGLERVVQRDKGTRA